MNKKNIIETIYNPYRFLETTNREDLKIFLKNQQFPEDWGIKELKLAWAFQGLLGTSVNNFDPAAEYMVYVYEPYITDMGKTLKQSLLNCNMEYHQFYYESNVKGHYALASLDPEYSNLSKKQRHLFFEHGYKIPHNNYQRIIALEKALDIAGDADSNNFRIISRLKSNTDLFSALCVAFEIPINHEEYYPRNAFRNVFSTNGELHPIANRWLKNWVEDSALKEHFSCFMETSRGSKDRKDIYLASHYQESWNKHLPLKNNFPTGLHYLNAFKNKDCLLGWEWEHRDLRESRALVRLKK